MGTPLSGEALDTIFRNARTYRAWVNKPVSDETLRAAWDLSKLGATSGNMVPQRIVFVKSPEAKARLKPCLEAGNVDKTMSAPATQRRSASLTRPLPMPCPA